MSKPELITSATWEEFGSKFYEGYQSIEPSTGGTIGGAIATMASTYTWNCNPRLDSSCGVLSYVDDGTLCYNNIKPGVMFACNAANVFTPKVQGAKVAPLWWLYAVPDANDVRYKKLLFDISHHHA